MSPRTFLHNISLFCLFFMFILTAATPKEQYTGWQPPITDTSITGDGTHESPLAVVHGTLVAATITQASTSAPSAYIHANIIDGDNDLTFTRDSAGVYKVECDNDVAFADSTRTYIVSVGSATAITAKFWRQSDSTAIMQFYNASATLVDLVGKAYIEIKGIAPEE